MGVLIRCNMGLSPIAIDEDQHWAETCFAANLVNKFFVTLAGDDQTPFLLTKTSTFTFLLNALKKLHSKNIENMRTRAFSELPTLSFEKKEPKVHFHQTVKVDHKFLINSSLNDLE